MAADEAYVRGNEGRLWALIEERMVPGADLKRIDRRIWDLFGEDWAVMWTDLAGFSRQAAAFGIIHFLRVIHEQRTLLYPLIADHDGVLLKAEADSLFIIFRRAESAIRCGIAMQWACKKASERRVPEDQILLCVGIGSGRVLRVGASDVYGTEVNAASKLGEDVAKAHEILVTKGARDAAGTLDGIQYLDLGIPVPGSEHNFRLKYGG